MNLFNRARRMAWWRGLVAALLRKDRTLSMLDTVDQSSVQSYQKLQRVAVPLSKIHGSVGRWQSYDVDFLPLNDHDMHRWVSVCVAMLSDPLQLPPVELIQVGDCYYVDDGHHRVSVSMVLDHISIDANVTVWQMPGESSASCV